jgi:hypothetical protein
VRTRETDAKFRFHQEKGRRALRRRLFVPPGQQRGPAFAEMGLWGAKWPPMGFTVANAGHGRSANAWDWHGYSAVLTAISACGFEANLGLLV